MIVKTRVFEYCNNSYKNLSELAQAMGIAVSQIYQVRKGTRHVGQEFIVGAINAFPDHKLDDLFYLIPEALCLSSVKAGHFGGNASYREHSAFPKAQGKSELL